ncbi:MAG: hypothetical protein R3F13_12340 [Prosthecobacter sp.]
MIPKCISNRPWLFVAAFFIGFVALWVWFISMAVRNAPQQVPVITRSVHAVD